jgi:hypothetical protein
MGKFEIKKLEELEYNEIVTLGVIESDEDLTTIFRESTNLPFSILRQMSKESQISGEITETLNAIFNSIILTKKEYINKYKQLGDANYVYKEPIIEQIVEIVNTNKAKPIKEGALPRRYGKNSIMKDVASQNGVITPRQRAQLATNDIKNSNCRLDKRLIKDAFTNENVLSDEQYRLIVSLGNIVKNKMKIILKTK